MYSNLFKRSVFPLLLVVLGGLGVASGGSDLAAVGVVAIIGGAFWLLANVAKHADSR